MVTTLGLGVLILVSVQNSCYTLLRRYSRGVLHETVSTFTVLGAAEALKFVISTALVDVPDGKGSPSCRRFNIVFQALVSSRAMIVPAVTYLIMNTLSFKAMELIDATVFSMIAQLKILSTAVFTSIVLGRQFSAAQWRAISLLTLLVMLITYQRGKGGVCITADGSEATVGFSASFLWGIFMVAVEVSLSGWISAYFEKYLKDGSASVWCRNLQLSFWSIAIYILMEGTRILQAYWTGSPRHAGDTGQPASSGWSWITVALVILGGGGGLLVAFAIKLADAVLKSMATAVALILVIGTEIVLMGVPGDPVVCMACIGALITLQVYQDAPKAAVAARPTVVMPAPTVFGESRTDEFGNKKKSSPKPDSSGTPTLPFAQSDLSEAEDTFPLCK